MYKIKEFSKVTNTSIVTLRYYDKINLFKPDYVDFYSGYRYYHDDQINVIKKINLLKYFGLSLEEIKEYLNTNNNQILIKKMKGYEKIMNEINNFLNKNNKEYKIIKSNYNKYLDLNGILNSKCAMALEIKDDNADYYYIKENDQIYADFVVYKVEKILTLDEKNLCNIKLLEAVFKEVKKDYDEVFIIVPLEKEEIINQFIKKYDFTNINQGIYKYKKFKIIL